MSKWSELAPPSIKYVQSRSLPEVHSPLAREPNTTRLVSSEVYPGIFFESSWSSSSRVFRAASRQVRNRPELGSPAEVAALDSVPGIEHHSNNLCALRFDVDQVRHPDSPIIEMARTIRMTPEQAERQRRSFGYGNVKIENDSIPWEMIHRAAEGLEER